MKLQNIIFTEIIIISLLFIVGCDRQADQEGSESDLVIQLPDSDNVSVQSPTLTEKYVGSSQCTSCHQQEMQDWQGSHHDLAMQHVSDKTVLGDFNNASFDYFGTVSKFYKQEGRYFVETDGPDGKLTQYPIAYTFGVYPLQQYLIEFPGGRLQALNIVWDSRTSQEGGQRWYHLYPNEQIKHDDELHWTGINQNWNYMCADCHSTNLQKNYIAKEQEYKTSWSEIDVACEACHGPGSQHVKWAGDGKGGEVPNKGFAYALDERRGIAWAMDSATGIAKRSKEKVSDTEIEVCARCHSRRGTAFPNTHPGDSFLDGFHPSLLTDPLYYPDGQIRDEVYVYGSFLQSKMYHAGVSCSDCHQPHSLKLRAEGNSLCGQCHLPAKYESASHHLHDEATQGSLCVNCHMPSKTYMGVDERRDHSFRIPRPDLSKALGVPNACTQCHSDRTDKWAEDAISKVHGKADPNHYAVILALARQGEPEVGTLLAKLILDDAQPAIVRATAVTLFPPYLSNETAQILQIVSQSDEPLLGLALATIADRIPSQYRPAFSVPLLYDNNRVTRSLAANTLSGISLEMFPKEVQENYKASIEEFVISSEFNADRPEHLTNLADHYTRIGSFQEAKNYYQRAIQVAPFYTPAHINYSDYYRRIGDEKKAQQVLNDALSDVRGKASIYHSLGLSYVRQKQMGTALEYLQQAADAEDAVARYSYVYAIALNSEGRRADALSVLEQALSRYGNDREILSALISIQKEAGRSSQLD
ncbi:multiheme c-type cytochrome [Porticoccaceae bacterium LTM1]|nr:multiheme c-type cytochrome [Porticoccaceae bacterium LTM1]